MTRAAVVRGALEDSPVPVQLTPLSPRGPSDRRRGIPLAGLELSAGRSDRHLVIRAGQQTGASQALSGDALLANTRCATPGSASALLCRPHGTYAACLGGQTVSAYEQNTQQSPSRGFSVSPQPVQR